MEKQPKTQVKLTLIYEIAGDYTEGKDSLEYAYSYWQGRTENISTPHSNVHCIVNKPKIKKLPKKEQIQWEK